MATSRPNYVTHSICDIKHNYSHLINPVGQMVEIGDRGEIKWRFCTGTNILNGAYYLTAAHCTTSNSEQPICISADSSSPVIQGRCVVNFDYDVCNMYKDTRLESLKFVKDGSYSQIYRVIDHGFCGQKKLDYSVLQLSPDAAQHGSLELSPETLRIGDRLMLVHHPEGFPKQYSTGNIQWVGNDTFNHSAHTKGGSSGAPSISLNTGGIVGTHVRGDGEYQTIHTAVTARSIVEDAATRQQSWANPYLRKFGIFRSEPSNAIVLYQPPEQKNCCSI